MPLLRYGSNMSWLSRRVIRWSELSTSVGRMGFGNVSGIYQLPNISKLVSRKARKHFLTPSSLYLSRSVSCVCYPVALDCLRQAGMDCTLENQRINWHCTGPCMKQVALPSNFCVEVRSEMVVINAVLDCSKSLHFSPADLAFNASFIWTQNKSYLCSYLWSSINVSVSQLHYQLNEECLESRLNRLCCMEFIEEVDLNVCWILRNGYSFEMWEELLPKYEFW